MWLSFTILWLLCCRALGEIEQNKTNQERFDVRTFDIVFTWVNGSDPFLFSEMKKAEPRYKVQQDRIQDREEMRYSLRSLSKFMPWWQGRLVIVTNHEPPSWLNLSAPGVAVYSHKDIWEQTELLPTFNSDGIEQHLRRIPNLTSHFLYFNDDMMLANPVLPAHLWSEEGRPRVRFTTNLVKFGKTKHDELMHKREKLWQANVFYTHEMVDRHYSAGKDHFLHHTPYPMLKSVLDHIHDRFAREVQVPMKCRQRCYRSLQIPSMHHWIATRENLADPIYNSSSLHQYLFVKTTSITNFTKSLRQIGPETLFFNLADYPVSIEFHKVVGDFLTQRFPVPSRYELSTAADTVFEQEREVVKPREREVIKSHEREIIKPPHEQEANTPPQEVNKPQERELVKPPQEQAMPPQVAKPRVTPLHGDVIRSREREAIKPQEFIKPFRARPNSSLPPPLSSVAASTTTDTAPLSSNASLASSPSSTASSPSVAPLLPPRPPPTPFAFPATTATISPLRKVSFAIKSNKLKTKRTHTLPILERIRDTLQHGEEV